LETTVNEMNQTSSTAPVSRRRRDYCWLPIAALEHGMVLAKPLARSLGQVATIFLAAGSRLTASTIVQMINKGVESVAVHCGARHDEASYTALAVQYEERLLQIFGDSPDDDCRALLDALLTAGPDLA